MTDSHMHRYRVVEENKMVPSRTNAAGITMSEPERVYLHAAELDGDRLLRPLCGRLANHPYVFIERSMHWVTVSDEERCPSCQQAYEQLT